VPPSTLIADAHKAGLLLHPYTFRNEGVFLATDYAGDPVKEYEQFFKLGVDGVFTDFSGTARPVVDRLFSSDVPGALAGRGTIGAAGQHASAGRHGEGRVAGPSPRDALFSALGFSGDDAGDVSSGRTRGKKRL